MKPTKTGNELGPGFRAASLAFKAETQIKNPTPAPCFFLQGKKVLVRLSIKDNLPHILQNQTY